MKKPEKFYTVSEAADELRMTKAGVHRAIKAKRLTAVWGETTRVVKALLIAEKDLKAFDLDVAQQARGKKIP